MAHGTRQCVGQRDAAGVLFGGGGTVQGPEHSRAGRHTSSEHQRRRAPGGATQTNPASGNSADCIC
jgi:hypothetical protein